MKKISAMNRKGKIAAVLLFQGLILAVMAVMLVHDGRSVQASIEDWKSYSITYDPVNGWFMDEQDFVWEKPITLIYGPYLALKKGTYRAEIEYSCSSDQTCYVRCERSRFDDAHLRGGEACLSRNQRTLQYDFEVTQDVEDFEFVVEYDGKGYLQVTDIEIVPSPLGAVRNICFVLALFLCLDVCFLLSDRIRKEREFLASLAGIALLASLPLFAPGIVNAGYDLKFHLMRIAGIARELRLGHVPVRLSSAWMEGYGYPVSVYYGDLLLYIPALMSLLGFSVTTAYKFYVFLINVGTAATACYGMHRICRDRRIALLASLAYCTASYRLWNIYIRAALGEFGATMFLPLIAAAVYGIYMDDAADRGRHRKNALLLAAGMSGVILTHTLSVDMTFFTLLFVCVALLKRTFRKEVISQYLLAVLATCGLCMYFIVPFLDYMASVPVKVSSAIDVRGGNTIQYCGISIAEYFTFDKSPGLVLLAVFFAAVVYCTKKRDQEMRWLTVGSGLAILATLSIFPWDYLARHSLFFALMAQIQFPYRYLCIVIVFLSLLLVFVMQRLRAGGVEIVRVERLVIAAGFIMTCFFTKEYLHPAEDRELIKPYSDAELDSYFVVVGEYLRAGVDLDTFPFLSPELFAEEMEEAEIVERRGSNMRLYCRALDEIEGGVVSIPMFYYKGYHVTDDEGNEYPIEDGDLKQITFSVPPGFEGYLNIEYREPWYWRAAEVVSLVSAIGLAAYLIRRKGVEAR